MQEDLDLYSAQGIATENAVSGLTRRHEEGSPLANIRNALLLEPGIIVGEVYWATRFAAKVRHSFGVNMAMPDFIAVIDGSFAILALLALGVYSILSTRSSTSQRRIRRALITGACAAIGTGVICYIEGGTFVLGTLLLLLVSIALPLYSIKGMLQKRRTTRILNQSAHRRIPGISPSSAEL